MTESNDDRLAKIEALLEELKKNQEEMRQDMKDEFGELKKRLDTFEGRFFEFTMRQLTANSSAFFGVGIAVLSAVIAYVVSVVSQKGM